MDGIKPESITFLINSMGGGAGRVCVTLANGFTEMGVKVELLVINVGDNSFREELNEHVHLTDLKAGSVKRALWHIARFLLINRPKNILVFGHQLSSLAVFLRKLLFIRCTIISRNVTNLEYHERYSKTFWHKRIVMKFVKRYYKTVDLAVSPGQSMKENLAAFGIQSKKIAVIYNPLSKNIEQIGHLYKHNTSNMKSEILFVGRLARPKAVHFLIEAFAGCIKKAPELTLRIIGEGEFRNELETLAQRLGVENKVIFTGYCKDVVKYYSQAKVTALTSLFEGLPNALIESISVGTPVVAFDCPTGPSEIIEDGVNGYLVEYMNTGDLVKKLLLAVGRNWNREDVKKTARKFSREEIVKQYLKAFENVK